MLVLDVCVCVCVRVCIARKIELGVSSFGVSITTMEEVFIKVGDGTDDTLETRFGGLVGRRVRVVTLSSPCRLRRRGTQRSIASPPPIGQTRSPHTSPPPGSPPPAVGSPGHQQTTTGELGSGLK